MGRWSFIKLVRQHCLYCLFQWCGYSIIWFSGFPGGSDGRVCLQWERLRFNHWVGKIPWRTKWQPTPIILVWKIPWWRSLAGYNPWGCKESGMTEQLSLIHTTNKIESVNSRSLSVPCLNCQELGAAGVASGNLEGKNLTTVLAAARVLPQCSLTRAS